MPLPAPHTTLRLLASVAAMMLCTGFTATLLPLAASDATAAARIASAHFAGALAGVPAAGPVIARLGAPSAALLFALTIALGTAGLAVTDGAPAWMALRFAAGVAASGYFVLV